jgi:xylulokinase
MKYLLTLDVGTTSVKAGLFSGRLEAVSFRIREYTLLTPQADFVELDPEVYWDNACAAIREVLTEAGISPKDVASITCTTQGETLIPVGKDGRALHNAIVWLDARAQKEARWICERMDRLPVYQRTGLPEVNGYTPVAKLLWIKNNLPKVYGEAEEFLLLEDYLVYRLCGQFVTNPALMCTTGYFDILDDVLFEEMFRVCGLDEQKIPSIRPCGLVVGTLKPDAAKSLGLPESVKVTTGAMDQVASAIGSGNITKGIVTETTGTCQAVAATVDKSVFPSWSPVTYYSHAIKGKLLKIVINQTAGIAYKWFRNEFCQDFINSGEDSFRLMDDLAANEPALSRGLSFFPHMTGMQFPQTDESVRGVFFGVGLHTTRGCFIRAIMEGVGYMLRESMDKMQLSPTRVISLGGGAKSSIWGQIKASICKTDFLVLENQESTSLGAAMLGGLAVGLFDSMEAASGQLTVTRSFSPNAEEIIQYEAGYKEYLNMYGQFAPLFQKRNGE